MRVRAGAIFTTLYLRTKNSSEETRLRAEKIASEIGSRHLEVPLDGIIASTLEMFRDVVGKTPSFAAAGGTQAENLALQNLQARSHMFRHEQKETPHLLIRLSIPDFPKSPGKVEDGGHLPVCRTNPVDPREEGILPGPWQCKRR